MNTFNNPKRQRDDRQEVNILPSLSYQISFLQRRTLDHPAKRMATLEPSPRMALGPSPRMTLEPQGCCNCLAVQVADQKKIIAEQGNVIKHLQHVLRDMEAERGGLLAQYRVTQESLRCEKNGHANTKEVLHRQWETLHHLSSLIIPPEHHANEVIDLQDD